MKREELEAMGLSKENIDAIMRQNGIDIENAKQNAGDSGAALEKSRADRLQEQLNTALAELTAAQQEGATAAQLRKNLENVTAQLNAATKANDIRAILEKEYKPKDVALLMKLIDSDKITINQDGTHSGLKEQVDPLKTGNSYLFSDTPDDRGGSPDSGNAGGAFDMNAFLRS